MYGLIEAGFPEAAIEAAEHALTLLERAFEQVDDSDGEMGSLAGRAREIHLAACEAARPDPIELGERLARWALRSGWEIFLDSVTAYAEILGESGLARFEEVVDEQWSVLPPLKPAPDKRWDGHRFRPTYLKEALAARRGVDALVEVIGHDLSSPYQFWRAAQALAEDDRIDDALAWLARGQAAYPANPDKRLVEALMWENDIDAAWHAAQQGGCTRSLWLKLSRARAQTHPADAMPILRREVLTAIEGGKRPAYQAAAQLAKELRDYARRAGQQGGFDEWIRQVRVDNSRRRALQDEFTTAGIG